jgi:nucleotide-binding universal stress UspA family protein
MYGSPFGRILVGVNGTSESERATAVAISLAKSLQAHLIVFGVIAPLNAETQAEGVGLDEASQARADLEAQVRAAGVKAVGLAIDVATEIVEGDPEKEIEHKIEEASVDLVVVGHRDISRIRHWLEGSTSEDLIRNSRTSILVVHDDHPQ